MNVNVEKINQLVEKIHNEYKDKPFGEFIISQINTDEFKKFLDKRLSEKDDYKMNVPILEYFRSFHCYPDRIENVILLNHDRDLVALREQGFFKDLNTNLVLFLNNTFSTNKQTGSVRSHHDYWRLFIINALDYLASLPVMECRFYFIGDDVTYDFAELVSDKEKFLLPDVLSECWTDGSMKNYDFIN